MTRAEAFFEQARSDFAVYELLQRQGTSAVPECHVLHYLQMATEKLAKAVAARTHIQVPPRRHDSFSRLATELAKRPDVLSDIGYSDPAQTQRFLKRCLGIFKQLENLNPALANEKAHDAGRDRESEPNCEYPWWRSISGREDWLVPATHTFLAFQTVRDNGDGATVMRMIQFLLVNFKHIP
jgi:hypothetical protein